MSRASRVVDALKQVPPEWKKKLEPILNELYRRAYDDGYDDAVDERKR